MIFYLQKAKGAMLRWNIGGHIEVYSARGEFLFSADTMAEADEMLEE